jgi:protein-disulfide isomerase
VETEPTIVQTYIATGKVKLIYRHLLQLGDGSMRTAEASECAADQDKFWPMHDALYARQSEVYGSSDLDATLADFAHDLGLDTTTFGDCMQSHKHVAAIQADYRAAQAAGVQSRPVFDIGQQRLVGALPLSTFQKQLDAALAP